MQQSHDFYNCNVPLVRIYSLNYTIFENASKFAEKQSKWKIKGKFS